MGREIIHVVICLVGACFIFAFIEEAIKDRKYRKKK